MRQREYVVFLVVATVLLAAGWCAGSGNIEGSLPRGRRGQDRPPPPGRFGPTSRRRRTAVTVDLWRKGP